MRLNNEEKGEAFVAENYDKSIEELTWHLIKEQLLKNNDIKVRSEEHTSDSSHNVISRMPSSA